MATEWIEVTPAEQKAARLKMKLVERRGGTASPAIKAIADAKPATVLQGEDPRPAAERTLLGQARQTTDPEFHAFAGSVEIRGSGLLSATKVNDQAQPQTLEQTRSDAIAKADAARQRRPILEENLDDPRDIVAYQDDLLTVTRRDKSSKARLEPVDRPPAERHGTKTDAVGRRVGLGGHPFV